MNLNELMTSDLKGIIPEIGESVVFTRNGTAKTVSAVIERNSQARISEAPFGLTYKSFLIVSTTDVPRINRDEDSFTFADILGGTATVHTVNSIITQDASHWKLAW